MRNPIPIPYSVKPLKRFAGICVPSGLGTGWWTTLLTTLRTGLRTTLRRAGQGRPPWVCRFALDDGPQVGYLGGAAAFALAGVLPLAAVIAGLTAALALAGVLAFAGVLVGQSQGTRQAAG